MKMHWEEDEFRYQEFTRVKASDTDSWDTAFALGFWDIQGQDL